MKNQGLDPEEIARLRKTMAEQETNFLPTEEEINNDQITHFLFVGNYKGKEVIFDAVMYTLRLAYNATLLEKAEEEAQRQFPDFKPLEIDPDKINNGLDEYPEYPEEIEEFIQQVMFDLQDEDELKVQEKVTIDEDFDYGLGLEVALNVEEITPEVVADFVSRYQQGRFEADPTRYSFQEEDDDEDDDVRR